jgi:hypothetical protein
MDWFPEGVDTTVHGPIRFLAERNVPAGSPLIHRPSGSYAPNRIPCVLPVCA